MYVAMPCTYLGNNYQHACIIDPSHKFVHHSKKLFRIFPQLANSYNSSPNTSYVHSYTMIIAYMRLGNRSMNFPVKELWLINVIEKLQTCIVCVGWCGLDSMKCFMVPRKTGSSNYTGFKPACSLLFKIYKYRYNVQSDMKPEWKTSM